MKDKKIKVIIFIILIVLVFILTKLYIHRIGEIEYQMSIYDNPISALKVVMPSIVLGILIYKLGTLLSEKKANFGKLLKILGWFQVFGGMLMEVVSFVIFIVNCFKLI